MTIPYYPSGIAYARGGRRLVTMHVERGSTTTEDGSASLDLWDTKTLRAVGEPLDFPAGGLYLTTSPDGRRVVHGSDAGFAVVWDLDPAHWERIACRAAGRVLTQAEWHQYLPGRPYRPACHRE
jgi:hypothetical protein